MKSLSTWRAKNAHNQIRCGGMYTLPRLISGPFILLAILVGLAVYATWPGQDTLDYLSCEPKSGLSQLSATLYGRFFWEQALTRARDLATGMESSDRDLAKMLDPAKAQRERDRRDREIYAIDPKMAPTDAERAAQRLRDQADQIEAQDVLNKILSRDRKIITDARRCQQVIADKLRTM